MDFSKLSAAIDVLAGQLGADAKARGATHINSGGMISLLEEYGEADDLVVMASAIDGKIYPIRWAQDIRYSGTPISGRQNSVLEYAGGRAAVKLVSHKSGGEHEVVTIKILCDNLRLRSPSDLVVLDNHRKISGVESVTYGVYSPEHKAVFPTDVQIAAGFSPPEFKYSGTNAVIVWSYQDQEDDSNEEG